MYHQKNYQDCNRHLPIPLGYVNEFDNEKIENKIPGCQIPILTEIKPFFKTVARKATIELLPVTRSFAVACESLNASILVSTFIGIFLIVLNNLYITYGLKTFIPPHELNATIYKTRHFHFRIFP